MVGESWKDTWFDDGDEEVVMPNLALIVVVVLVVAVIVYLGNRTGS